MQSAGISFVTILPAPMTELLPMVTPGIMTAPEKKDLNISEIAEMTGFCTVSYTIYIVTDSDRSSFLPLQSGLKKGDECL